MTYDSSDIYWERKNAGRCVRCGREHENVKSGKRVMCPACARKNSEYVLSIRAKRLAEGTCAYCGKKPARPGKTMCFECACKAAEWSLKSKKKKRAEGENAQI